MTPYKEDEDKRGLGRTLAREHRYTDDGHGEGAGSSPALICWFHLGSRKICGASAADRKGPQSWLKAADNEFARSKLARGYFYIRLLASAPMETHWGLRASSWFAPAASCQRLAAALTHCSASPPSTDGTPGPWGPPVLSPQAGGRGPVAARLHAALRRELAAGRDTLVK